MQGDQSRVVFAIVVYLGFTKHSLSRLVYPRKPLNGISGHSMRVGGAQDLLIGDASLPQIMVTGGWAKTDTVMRYVERVGHRQR